MWTNWVYFYIPSEGTKWQRRHTIVDTIVILSVYTMVSDKRIILIVDDVYQVSALKNTCIFSRQVCTNIISLTFLWFYVVKIMIIISKEDE